MLIGCSGRRATVLIFPVRLTCSSEFAAASVTSTLPSASGARPYAFESAGFFSVSLGSGCFFAHLARSATLTSLLPFAVGIQR